MNALEQDISGSAWCGLDMRLRQGTDTIHASGAAVDVFPDQLIPVGIPAHNTGSPAKNVKVQFAFFPNHAGRRAQAVLECRVLAWCLL